jgi:uncharacterized peroxidase-related enzyme
MTRGRSRTSDPTSPQSSWHTSAIASSPSFLSEPPATPEVNAVYEDSLADDGFVPNYCHLWAWRPDVLGAFDKLRADLLADSSLSRREAAVMVTATAATLGDSYCSLAWGERLADATDEATAAGVLRGVDDGLSEREAALATWARALVDDPNATTEAGVDRLRRAGFSEREIFEATVWIGLRLGFSTINDALGARPDRQLVERVPAPVREAVSFGRAAPDTDS